MDARQVVRDCLPPVVLRWARRLRQRGSLVASDGYRYCPDGWPSREGQGWQAQSVVDAYLSSWTEFLRDARNNTLFAMKDAAATPGYGDYLAHNTLLVFAYALLRAARNRERLKVLDWGGGLGQYFVVAQNILPGVALEWTVKDLPSLCEAGARLVPDARFIARDEEVLPRAYDLVLASSSLQYSEHWQEAAATLARATGGYLLVTRLPVCHQVDSFVVVQRVANYGTEYPGWIINRSAFLGHLGQPCGMRLLREFLVFPGPEVPAAPGPHETRGFLFQPMDAQTP
jgi:putative methyltransferase (TIGR04325 family)